MQSSGKFKDGKLLADGNGSTRMVNAGGLAALTMKSKNTDYGNVTIPMVNSGMKVALNTARKRVLGRLMMRRANS